MPRFCLSAASFSVSDFSLSHLAGEGATVLLSLAAAHELDGDALLIEQTESQQAGVAWIRLPLLRGAMPDRRAEQQWLLVGLILRERLRRGETLVFSVADDRAFMLARRLGLELDLPLPGLAALSPRQQEWAERARPIPAEEDHRADRRLGCLIGGMLGDALGYPLEFMQLADWGKVFGELVECARPRLECSDDSQLTLATLYGLRASASVAEMPMQIRAAYLAWYAGQMGHPVHCRWMRDHPAMLADRAPGATCLDSLARHAAGVGNVDNDRKGAGALMRVAPLAFLNEPLPLRQQLAALAGGLTHRHPTSRHACRIWIHLLDALSRDEPLDAVIDALLPALQDEAEAAEIRHALRAARHLAPAAASVAELGEGWVAEEALAIAVFAARTGADDWHHVARLAICNGGDSDTTGSLALQLFGARYGLSALPWALLEKLDLLSALLALETGFEPIPASGF